MAQPLNQSHAGGQSLRQQLLDLNETRQPTLMWILDAKLFADLKRKIDLCSVACNWNLKDEPDESKLISNKTMLLGQLHTFCRECAQTLLRKRQTLPRRKWVRMLARVRVLVGNGATQPKQKGKLMELISSNLGRSLPSLLDQDEDEDENAQPAHFPEPAWEHLGLIYNIAIQVARVDLGNSRSKDAKDQQGPPRLTSIEDTLQRLVPRIRSLDERERERVTGVLHTIYAKHEHVRATMRKQLKDQCFCYIMTTTMLNVKAPVPPLLWVGIPEILALFDSIITGLRDAKSAQSAQNRTLITEVLMPLHKASVPNAYLSIYLEPMISCFRHYVQKDATSLAVILSELLKCWPKPEAAQRRKIFIIEAMRLIKDVQIGQILDRLDCAGPDSELDDLHRCIKEVMDQIREDMNSLHHDVASTALAVWKEDTWKILCRQVFRERCWLMACTLQLASKTHFNKHVRDESSEIIEENMELFQQFRDVAQQFRDVAEETEGKDADSENDFRKRLTLRRDSVKETIERQAFLRQAFGEEAPAMFVSPTRARGKHKQAMAADEKKDDSDDHFQESTMCGAYVAMGVLPESLDDGLQFYFESDEDLEIDDSTADAESTPESRWAKQPPKY